MNDTPACFYVNRCVHRYMAESYQMLIEGVPPAMIENAAKMAGMPVGPLALTDETAIDLAQKIMKQTISRSRRQGCRSGAVRTHQHDGRQARPPWPQERQGLLRLPGQAGQEASLARPEGSLSAEAAEDLTSRC